MFNDSARATDSYDVDANGYVTNVAENDAGKRAVTEIADEMMTRLNLFMQRRAASAARPG